MQNNKKNQNQKKVYQPRQQQQPQFAPDPSTPHGQQAIQQRYRQQRPQGQNNQQMRMPNPQMLMGLQQISQHRENLEQMDQTQLEALTMSLLVQFGPELLQNIRHPGQNMRGMRGGPPQRPYPPQMQQNYSNQPQFQGGYYPQPNQYPPQQNIRYQPRPRAPAPEGSQNQQQQNQNQQILPRSEFLPNLGQNEEEIKEGQNEMKDTQPFLEQSNLLRGLLGMESQLENLPSAPVPSGPPQQQQRPQDMPLQNQQPLMPRQYNPLQLRAPGYNFNQVQRNLCAKHFPEPLIIWTDRPLCKKCIPEYFQSMRGVPKRQFNQDQSQMLAQAFGINIAAMNAYQSEKNQISRGLDRILEIQKDYRYHQEELKEREKYAEQYLIELPDLMNSMFDGLEDMVAKQEQIFRDEISDVVRKQKVSINRDIQSKVPNFTSKLSQKYQQLQQASALAFNASQDEQINVLQQYIQIFTDLDAEFEKYFNEFEQIGKLQRLLDEDPNDIIRDFSELVEKNLRLDFNLKNSFMSLVPQRLHSFQWNQRHVQIFKIKSHNHERRFVQMDFEIPLYSRSIAVEGGSIYLIGGYIKRSNQYLNTCFRYDELFGSLQKEANMIYPHADHSVCAIEGFIYVVGAFAHNQVYGYCERFDTQKNKWKIIAPLKIPRTGVALCSFKNQYLFAFGGRIDQKHIVDVIEVYDIKRNVWQEIPTNQVDKSRWVPAYMSLAYQITDKEIMIFGGKSSITFQIFNGVFIFDIEKMQIFERGSLVSPCSFMNVPLLFNHTLYAYGNDVYIHKYSIPEQKWSVTLKDMA